MYPSTVVAFPGPSTQAVHVMGYVRLGEKQRPMVYLSPGEQEYYCYCFHTR